jgi:hypothetical protein
VPESTTSGAGGSCPAGSARQKARKRCRAGALRTAGSEFLRACRSGWCCSGRWCSGALAHMQGGCNSYGDIGHFIWRVACDTVHGVWRRDLAKR